MNLSVSATVDLLPLREPFTLARGTVTEIELLLVELRDEHGHIGHIGRGEAPGLPYAGETGASMQAQILEPGVTPQRLLELLPPGGARNALDCALWDLRARQTGQRAWHLAGMADVQPVTTALTLGIAPEAEYRERVARHTHMPLLKLKANRERHVELVRIAREEHPTARLILDANQSLDRALLDQLTPELHALGVELIEQPVPVGSDEQLRGYGGAIPLAADESCTDRISLPALTGLYQFINIKLDKCGGLTEGLALAHEARQRGFGLMVGNMGGTSLSMAPHFLIAQQCAYVDLDAPLLFKWDREVAIEYAGAEMKLPEQGLWG